MSWLSCVFSNVLLALPLALSASFTQRWLRREAMAHFFWVLVLVKLVTPPLMSGIWDDPPGKTACVPGTCRCELHVQHQSATSHQLLISILLVVWSVGAGATAWIAYRHWNQFRRLITKHAIPAPQEWQLIASNLSRELSLRRPPQILAVPGRLPPMVIPGWRRARMLLPSELLDRLNDSQRTVLVLHELIHLKRRDHLVRLLELMVSVAYWWLPIVGMIGRQLRDCEEACCDAAVVARHPQARREYARLLLDVLDFVSISRRSIKIATGISSSVELERRLRTILDDAQPIQRAWPVGFLAASLACGVIPCELHCDWASLLRPMTASGGHLPAQDAISTPAELGNAAEISFACCPS